MIDCSEPRNPFHSAEFEAWPELLLDDDKTEPATPALKAADTDPCAAPVETEDNQTPQ